MLSPCSWSQVLCASFGFVRLLISLSAAFHDAWDKLGDSKQASGIFLDSTTDSDSLGFP